MKVLVNSCPKNSFQRERLLGFGSTDIHGVESQSLGVFKGLEEKWGKGRVSYCKPLGQKYTDVITKDGKALMVVSSPERN